MGEQILVNLGVIDVEQHGRWLDLGAGLLVRRGTFDVV